VVTVAQARQPAPPWPFVLHVAAGPGKPARTVRASRQSPGDADLLMHYAVCRAAGWPGRGHLNAEPGADRPARWGQRWSFELAPVGPGGTVVTEIFDCSQVPEDQRVDIDYGRIWVESMGATLERLDALCARHGNQSGQGVIATRMAG